MISRVKLFFGGCFAHMDHRTLALKFINNLSDIDITKFETVRQNNIDSTINKQNHNKI